MNETKTRSPQRKRLPKPGLILIIVNATVTVLSLAIAFPILQHAFYFLFLAPEMVNTGAFVLVVILFLALSLFSLLGLVKTCQASKWWSAATVVSLMTLAIQRWVLAALSRTEHPDDQMSFYLVAAEAVVRFTLAAALAAYLVQFFKAADSATDRARNLADKGEDVDAA